MTNSEPCGLCSGEGCDTCNHAGTDVPQSAYEVCRCGHPPHEYPCRVLVASRTTKHHFHRECGCLVGVDGEEGDGALMAMLLNNIQRTGVTTICVSVADARRMLNWREHFDVVQIYKDEVAATHKLLDEAEAWSAEHGEELAEFRAWRVGAEAEIIALRAAVVLPENCPSDEDITEALACSGVDHEGCSGVLANAVRAFRVEIAALRSGLDAASGEVARLRDKDNKSRNTNYFHAAERARSIRSRLRFVDGLVGFLGSGENARGRFPKNLTELNDDLREFAHFPKRDK